MEARKYFEQSNYKNMTNQKLDAAKAVQKGKLYSFGLP